MIYTNNSIIVKIPNHLMIGDFLFRIYRIKGTMKVTQDHANDLIITMIYIILLSMFFKLNDTIIHIITIFSIIYLAITHHRNGH